MQILRPIFCNHSKVDRVTLDDGENICKNCGTVMGRTDTTKHYFESNTNLFTELQIGSKQNNSLPSQKLLKYNETLSQVSNICRILEMPNSVSNDIWFWFNKIKSNIKIPKAKILVLVIYQLCRYNQIPINKSHLLLIIKTQLGAKNAPTPLSIISEISSYLDENGIPIIDKIGFSQFTTHDVIFSLRSKIKTLNTKYPPQIVSKINDIALSLIDSMDGTDEQKATKSIKIAKIRCGLS